MFKKPQFFKKRTYTENNPKLKRRGNYREKFFKHNPGHDFGRLGRFYICPYCGKLMKNIKRITVDHIYSIRAVQRNRKLRARFDALPDGVNDPSNLVACCRGCNSRKGTKGGAWILLGRYGHRFMPFVRLAVFVLLAIATVWGISHLAGSL